MVHMADVSPSKPNFLPLCSDSDNAAIRPKPIEPTSQ